MQINVFNIAKWSKNGLDIFLVEIKVEASDVEPRIRIGRRLEPRCARVEGGIAAVEVGSGWTIEIGSAFGSVAGSFSPLDKNRDAKEG